MRSERTPESTVLGYRIERLDEYDENGLHAGSRYEVICPHSGNVLVSLSSLRAARRYVLAHEMRQMRQAKSDSGRRGAA